MKSMYSLPSTSRMRQPSPSATNCGKDAGRARTFWWPYMPPGITCRARSRSSWSRVRGRVAVAEHDRAVAAHEVDVLVAVDVADAAAVALGHELREGRRQGPHVLVAVHAAGDHLPGALAQLVVAGAGPGVGRRAGADGA